MLLCALNFFLLFILLSALFSSFKKAFIAANPYKLEYLEKRVASYSICY
jgi:putative hemolysin